jgi:hypothetical protein
VLTIVEVRRTVVLPILPDGPSLVLCEVVPVFVRASDRRYSAEFSYGFVPWLVDRDSDELRQNGVLKVHLAQPKILSETAW